jgi:hypothetical protein
MEKDIEKLFKKALDGHELPYQEGAWESFEKKMNLNSSKQTYKWWISLAAVLVIAVSAFFIVNKNDSQNQLNVKNNGIKNKPILEYKNEKQAAKDELKIGKKKNKNKLNKIEIDVNSNSSLNDSPVLSINFNTNTNSQNNTSYPIVPTEISQENNPSTINKENLSQNPNIIKTKEPNFPTFGNKCKGETILFDTNGSYSVILKSPSGKVNEFENNSKSEFILKETGIYHIGFYDPASHGNFKETSNFRVNNSPTINLNVDDVLTYENGLPMIKAEVNTSEENVLWKIENERKSTFQHKPKSTEFYFFSKGNYNVVVKASNEFGCESKESKSVFISEDYNLLAVNAFNPNSSDVRNNTFIPYALKVRNTAFRMVILDPDNGSVVFESTDASNPWDGIDRKDGKMVPAQKAYIWKVSILNPEQGEKSEYKGTIVRVL